MEASVYSAHWHRLASQRPRLRPEVRVQRQPVRGQTWFLLSDPDTGHSVRLNRVAYELAARLDGQRAVDALWQQAQDRAVESAHEDAPTQPEIETLLRRLHQAGLLAWPGEGPAPVWPGPEARPTGRSLLSWRMPLVHPARLLDALAPLGRAVFSPKGATAVGAALLLLLMLVVAQGPTLMDHTQRWLDTPWLSLLGALIYLPVKLVHELAHGLAVQRWGGRVREAGVTWMLGLPMPYVDASAANAFGPRHQRLAVSAAGLGAELMLGLAGLLAWTVQGEGWGRDLAFAVFFSCAVSTLVFNANPLQRMDGYHMLCDALGLPNLATRSRELWRGLARRRLLGVVEVEVPTCARAERIWLWAYAPLSFAWTLGVLVAITRWVAGFSMAAGFVVGLVALVGGVLRPGLQGLRALRLEASAQVRSTRRLRAGMGVALGLAIGLAVLPWPRHLVVEGLVMPGEAAQLRAGHAGVVSRLLRHHGDEVEVGDAVLELADAEGEARLQQARERREAIEGEWIRAQRSTDREAAGAGAADLGALAARRQMAQAELDQQLDRAQARVLRARARGRLALPGEDDLPGRWLREGELVGEVLGPEAPVVRVAVPAERAEDLRRAASGALVGQGASVRLATHPDRVEAAQVLRDGGGAGWVLPGAALAARHGGSWLTEPAREGQTDPLRPREPLVWIDLRLDRAATEDTAKPSTEAAPATRGQRAWARFDLGWTPLAGQAAQALARAWRRQAHPGS